MHNNEIALVTGHWMLFRPRAIMRDSASVGHGAPPTELDITNTIQDNPSLHVVIQLMALHGV